MFPFHFWKQNIQICEKTNVSEKISDPICVQKYFLYKYKSMYSDIYEHVNVHVFYIFIYINLSFYLSITASINVVNYPSIYNIPTVIKLDQSWVRN